MQKKRVFSTILEMSEYKKQGSCKALIVTGCMAQRYKQEIQEESAGGGCHGAWYQRPTTRSWRPIDEGAGRTAEKLDCAEPCGYASESRMRAVMLTTGGHYAYSEDRRGLQQALHLLHHSDPARPLPQLSPWKNWWRRHRNLQKRESKS